MSVRFPTLALAVAYTGYKANEDVWVGGDTQLGDHAAGYYVFRRGADTPAGPGVIVVPNGRLERTSDPNAQYDALAVRTAERLRPDLDDLDARIEAMETALSNAINNLPAQVAEHLKTGDPLSIAGEVSAVGGASAADIGTEVAAKVLDVDGLLPAKLSPDVVNAIGSAVNEALRDGGALPVAGGVTPQDLANGAATAPVGSPAAGSQIALLSEVKGELTNAATVPELAAELLGVKPLYAEPDSQLDVLRSIRDGGIAAGTPGDPATAEVLSIQGVPGGAPIPISLSSRSMLGYVGGDQYKVVSASQSGIALGTVGAVGDYLSHLLVIPATTSPGAVSIADGNGVAITLFAGGAGSVASIAPFIIPLCAKCVVATTPGWKVTTGADVSVICVGTFS